MTYLSEVLADAPTRYWRLADPGGAWCHDIGSIGIPLVVKQDIAGSLLPLGYSGPNSDGGSAAVFAPSYLQREASLPVYPFSIECLVWLHYVAAVQQSIVAWDYDTQGVGLSVGGALPGVYVAYRTAGNIAGGVPSAYLWDHLVVTYTAAATVLYVNGVNVAAGAGNGVMVSQGLYVGRTRLNAQPFQGQIAELAIYPVALTGARVTAHFNAITSRTAPPVFSAASGGTGASVNPAYQGNLQDILRSVRKVY